MDSEVFRNNLRELLRQQGLKQKEFAKLKKLSYAWVRRVCSQGLTRVEDRNREQVQAICDYFEVTPVERMWSPELLSGRDTADEYADMVRDIMRWTASMSGMAYESIEEVQAVLLMEDIRRMHEVLKLRQWDIEQVHKSRWEFEQEVQKESRRRRDSEKSESAAKSRSPKVRAKPVDVPDTPDDSGAVDPSNAFASAIGSKKIGGMDAAEFLRQAFDDDDAMRASIASHYTVGGNVASALEGVVQDAKAAYHERKALADQIEKAHNPQHEENPMHAIGHLIAKHGYESDEALNYIVTAIENAAHAAQEDVDPDFNRDSLGGSRNRGGRHWRHAIATAVKHLQELRNKPKRKKAEVSDDKRHYDQDEL